MSGKWGGTCAGARFSGEVGCQVEAARVGLYCCVGGAERRDVTSWATRAGVALLLGRVYRATRWRRGGSRTWSSLGAEVEFLPGESALEGERVGGDQ